MRGPGLARVTVSALTRPTRVGIRSLLPRGEADEKGKQINAFASWPSSPPTLCPAPQAERGNGLWQRQTRTDRHHAPPSGTRTSPIVGRSRGAFSLIASLLLLCAGTLKAAEVAPGDLILAVHPYLPYSALQVRFEPLARYLAAGLDRPVKVRIGRDYEEHIDEVGRDQVDIAYMGPVSYVRLVQRYGAKPLLARLERSGRATQGGHIVVRNESPLRTLSDLQGHSFAFGAPESTMSSVVPQAVLAEAGIRLGDLRRVMRFRGYSNVALAVLSGQTDAGAVKNEVYEDFARLGLRSLTRLPEVSEHLFVTRADMPPAEIERLRELLLNLAQVPGGLEVLKAIHRDATALVPVSDRDYDNLRALLQKIDESDDQQRRAQ